MAHIHDQPGQVDFTVTLYIFRQKEDRLETMLHMHKKYRRLLPVGGHVEIDETPWQAIAHELEEESGYEIGNLDILQPKLRMKSLPKVTLHPQPIALNTHDATDEHFHSDISYAFFVKSEPTKPLADGESHDIRWLSQDELNNLDADQIFDANKEVCNFVFDNFDEWEQVTASDFSLTKGA